MKQSIMGFIQSFPKGHERTVKAKKQIILGFLTKGAIIFIKIMFIPLMLSILSELEYGVWLTLTSVLSWFTFFDLGLGNGLRNKLTHTITNMQFKRSKIYVSTAYAGLFIIVILLLIVFLVLIPLLNWNKIFNLPDSYSEFRLIVSIVIYFFLLSFVLKLINSILLANLMSGINGLIGFIVSFLSFILLYVFKNLHLANFISASFIISTVPVIVLFLVTIILFNGKLKNIRPSCKLISFSISKDLFSIGFKFFYIQVAVIILFTTDNFIISKVLGPEEVVPYNISFKYFSVISMFFSIIIAPLWSSITEAYAKNDFIWIRRSIRKVLQIWIGCFIIIMIMLFFSSDIYHLWVGDAIKIPFLLSTLMSVFVLLMTFSSIFTSFINGVGAVKIQMYTATISMIINIPLSIFFAKNLDLGSSGVILATCVSLSYSAILRPLQYYKIINKTARGIWIE